MDWINAAIYAGSGLYSAYQWWNSERTYNAKMNNTALTVPLMDRTSRNMELVHDRSCWIETLMLPTGKLSEKEVHSYCNANDIYRPRGAGVAASSFRFAEMAAKYDHWVVLNSHLTIHWQQLSNGNSNYYHTAALSYLDDDLPPATLSDLHDVCQHGAVSMQWGIGGGTSLVHIGAQTRATVSTFNAADFYTIDDPNGEDTIGGSGTASPTELAIYVYAMYNASSTAVPADTYFDLFCVLDFDVLWSEPKITI